jgi:hypothetical protein
LSLTSTAAEAAEVEMQPSRARLAIRAVKQ